MYTLVVPSPPINVMSELITSRMASITWKAGILPSLPVLLITEYNVFLNGTLINSNVNRTVTLSDLIPFTTYIVTVTARNAIGDSEMSEPHVFTTMEEGKILRSNLVQVIIYLAFPHASMLFYSTDHFLVNILHNITLFMPLNTYSMQFLFT